jgi:hypothetical protein
LLLAIQPRASSGCAVRCASEAVGKKSRTAADASPAPASGVPGGASGRTSKRGARCPFGWMGSWMGASAGKSDAAAAAPTRPAAADRSSSGAM